jgi:hypothetical protein
MKPTAKRAVRITFIITILWIALLQYVVLVIARAEPYPAVILPGFPASCPGCLMETGLPVTKSPELRARFADGRTQQISIRSILPPGPSVSLLAFSAAFADPTVKSDPDTIAWLQSRTERLFPDEDVVGFHILWRSTTYKAADESSVEHVPLYTINVDFGDSK